MKTGIKPSVLILGCFLSIAGARSLAFAQGPGAPPRGASPSPGSGLGPGSANTGPHDLKPDRHPAPPRTAGGVTPARPSGQFGPVGRWWDDRSVVHSIGLRKEQQKKMDAIFDSNKTAILQTYKAFLGEQAKLDAINKNHAADQATTFAAIDAVSNARAALQKATAQMLLEIRHQMDPDQIARLEKLP